MVLGGRKNECQMEDKCISENFRKRHGSPKVSCLGRIRRLWPADSALQRVSEGLREVGGKILCSSAKSLGFLESDRHINRQGI